MVKKSKEVNALETKILVLEGQIHFNTNQGIERKEKNSLKMRELEDHYERAMNIIVIAEHVFRSIALKNGNKDLLRLEVITTKLRSELEKDVFETRHRKEISF